MYYALCLSYHSNTETALFACFSSGWATTMGRLLGPKVGNSPEVLIPILLKTIGLQPNSSKPKFVPVSKNYHS